MKTIKHTKSFTLEQPVDLLFPLFSAEGEKLWVPGWDYENIMDSTELREDYIFLTQSHDHASTKAIWLVKQYKPETYFVQFYKVEPEDKVGIITVSCQPLKSSLTEVTVSYEYIALSPTGETFIKMFTPNAYEAFIGEWESLLISYFDN